MAIGDPIRLGLINESIGPSGGGGETQIRMPGSSSTVPALHVRAPNALGIIGSSNDQVGVWGGSQSHNGVFATSSLGNGCLGSSERGAGIFGQSQNGVGVVGRGERAGVFAAINRPASGALAAVHAQMHGAAGSTPALLAECEVPGSQRAAEFKGTVYIPVGSLRMDSGSLFISDGQLSVSEQIECDSYVECTEVRIRPPGASALGTSSSSGDRHLRPLACPEGRLEVFGRAEMVQGRAQVHLDSTLTLAQDDSYHVFITPEGDSNGLYVSSRTRSGFEVSEQQGGTSDLTFSYRVVAKRKDMQTPAGAVEVAAAAPRMDAVHPAREATPEPPAPLPETYEGTKPRVRPATPSPPPG